MNLFKISSLCVILTSFGMSVFLFTKAKHNKSAKIFSGVTICSGLWGVSGYVFSTIKEYDRILALRWLQFGYTGVILTVVFFYHFVMALFKVERKWHVILAYALGIIFTFLNWYDNSRLFLCDIRFIFGSFYWHDWIRNKNPIFLFYYILFYWLILGYSFLTIVKNFNKAVGAKRLQIKYFLVGSIIGWIGAEGQFLPDFYVDIYPFCNFLIAIYPIIFTYAIVRHNLMDINVIIKKTLVFAGLLTAMLGILIVPMLIMQEYAARRVDFTGKLLGLVISGIIIILVIKRIENFLINITDKFLFQKKYSYKDLLKTFTDEVLTIFEIDPLLEMTAAKLSEIVKLYNSSVLLFDKKSGLFTVKASSEDSLKGVSISQELLAEGKDYVLRRNVDDEDPVVKTSLDAVRADLIIPVMLKDEMLGAIALGKKKSDEEFGADDLDILIPLAQALAIAISNANLFDELTRKRLEITRKDKMATIGTLAAGMAHEIRNPITTIRTFADFLPEKYSDTIFMEKFGKLIPLEIERIDTIARSLLEFSTESSQGVEREEVDLAGVIRKYIDLLRPQYKFSVMDVAFELDGEPRFKANAQQVSDAIFYIVKYILAESPKDAAIKIFIRGQDRSLTAAFKIDAPIITESVIKDVFAPLAQRQLERRGFGFELFIAKQLIEKNGGVFSVTADKGKDAGAGSHTEFKLSF